jgi:hypothetical protein
MEYRSYKELEGKTLNCGDLLVFGRRIYRVDCNYLYHTGSGDSSTIFSDLGILNSKLSFCSEAYGYEAKTGYFPYYHNDDFISATRVALKLFAKLEGINNSSVIPTKTMEKKVIKVLAVDKKTGKISKEETVVAENETSAILKAFGVDTEGLFLKTTVEGTFTEEKPINAIIVKDTK